MRIVSGRFKGRVLKAPKGQGTRPTVDRVREAMASSIMSAWGGPVGGAVLDAFGGSGALGLEMLSRGASSCLFFERDRRARQTLQANIEALGLTRGEARVVPRDVQAAAAAGPLTRVPFELVLLDPPYKVPADEVWKLVGDLAAHGDLAPFCVVVYEHSAETGPGEVPPSLAAHRLALHGSKRYGIVGVTIVTLTAGNEED